MLTLTPENQLNDGVFVCLHTSIVLVGDWMVWTQMVCFGAPKGSNHGAMGPAK